MLLFWTESKYFCDCFLFSPRKAPPKIRKTNPFKNRKVMMKLNPYADTLRQAAIDTMEESKKAKEARLQEKSE